MASLKEIIAKRKELSATNPNATNADARKALMPSASVTPAVVEIGGPKPIPETTRIEAAPATAPQQPVQQAVPVETLGQKNARQQAEFAAKMSAPTVTAEAAPAPVTAPMTPTSGSIYDVVPPAPSTQVAKAPEIPKQAPSFMTEAQREAKLGQVDQKASRDQMLANVDIMAKEDGTVMTDRAKFEAKTGYA